MTSQNNKPKAVFTTETCKDCGKEKLNLSISAPAPRQEVHDPNGHICNEKVCPAWKASQTKGEMAKSVLQEPITERQMAEMNTLFPNIGEFLRQLQSQLSTLKSEQETMLTFFKNAISRFKYDVTLANGNKETIQNCREECKRCEREILSEIPRTSPSAL